MWFSAILSTEKPNTCKGVRLSMLLFPVKPAAQTREQAAGRGRVARGLFIRRGGRKHLDSAAIVAFNL